MTSPASGKVAEQIKTIAAQMLQRRIHDPRVEFVTITDVRLSKDWHQAELFYRVIGDDAAWKDAQEGLAAATGQIRTEVSKQLKMRFAPTIAFLPDTLPEQGKAIDDLVAKVRATDEQLAAISEGAQYAGEADPYRKPVDADTAVESAAEADVTGDKE